MTEPTDKPRLHGEATLATRLNVLRTLIGDASARETLGWATVDFDRAETQLAPALPGRGAADVTPAADDTLLGARCRLLRSSDRDFEVVLLEPSIEGLLAASLARFGEGFVVRYVIVGDRFADLTRRAGAADLALSRTGDGPFGRQRLVLGGPRWGPYLVISAGVEASRK